MTLGNLNFSDFGIIPGRAANSNQAISGAWDMPSRLGKTFHDWGTGSDSIEPYVLAEEIRFGGRDIGFTGFLKAAGENEALRAVYSFYDAVSGLTGLVPFATTLGTWNVYVRDEMRSEYLKDGWCKLEMKFREPVVSMDGVVPAATNADLGIDGISFADLGLAILSVDGRFNRPAAKTGEVISYANEGYSIGKVGAREVALRAFIRQGSYEGFVGKINGLAALFAKPGLRYITYRNDALRDFFIKDGFSVTEVRREQSGLTTGILTVKLTEVTSHLDWSFLMDSKGNEITDLNGQKIIIT